MKINFELGLNHIFLNEEDVYEALFDTVSSEYIHLLEEVNLKMFVRRKYEDLIRFIEMYENNFEKRIKYTNGKI